MGEHDQLFKRAFRIPKNAAGELASVLPPALLAVLDLEALELVPSDVVDAQLHERFSDALFRTRFRGQTGYVWLLLEHQSEPDRIMPLRVLNYMVRSWMELLRREPERERLPPMVCVVVHHGQTWTAPRRLHELIEGLGPELKAFIPDFELVIDDLSLENDEALATRPLDPFAKSVLWLLRDSRDIDSLLLHLKNWAAELEYLTQQADDDAVTLLRYILLVAGD